MILCLREFGGENISRVYHEDLISGPNLSTRKTDVSDWFISVCLTRVSNIQMTVSQPGTHYPPGSEADHPPARDSFPSHLSDLFSPLHSVSPSVSSSVEILPLPLFGPLSRGNPSPLAGELCHWQATWLAGWLLEFISLFYSPLSSAPPRSLPP